jgi:hypothetical protein
MESHIEKRSKEGDITPKPGSFARIWLDFSEFSIFSGTVLFWAVVPFFVLLGLLYSKIGEHKSPGLVQSYDGYSIMVFLGFWGLAIFLLVTSFAVLLLMLLRALVSKPEVTKAPSDNSGTVPPPLSAAPSSSVGSNFIFLFLIGVGLLSLANIGAVIPLDYGKLWIGIPVMALAWAIAGPGYAAGSGVVFLMLLIGAFTEAGLITLGIVAFAAFKRWSHAKRRSSGA